MNAKVEEKKPDLVTVTIDGVEIQAPKGASIIKVADDHGIDIPRFCYHRKLSVPANCRMCLVDVEMGGKPAPKPLPACATAIADGMVVSTESERAIKAQKGVMEFLLINHPLDCPICDQGGECELQDVAMGYGRSVSRFSERKRVVKDEDLGPLVSTDMTRCIHCTRCVRFLDEIAGTTELGMMFRGEHSEIGTFIGAGVHSELSGNIIDLCPVGALTNKPFRFRARAWEMLSHPSVAPHDAIGSNISLHQVRGTIKRVVPRDNDLVNESWIADRDRYSYEGIYAEDRAQQPMVKRDGTWEEVDWQEALEVAANGLRDLVDRDGAGQLGALVSPSATTEEMYLLGRLVRGLGSDNIDHRLRQGDFRDDAAAGAPLLGCTLPEVDGLNAALVVGGYTRHDQPMLNHRLRKVSRAGGTVMFMNPRRFDWNFAPAVEHVCAPAAMVAELALVATAAAQMNGESVEGLDDYTAGGTPSDAHREIAEALIGGERSAVITGNLVEVHPAGAELRFLTALLGRLTGSSVGNLGHGANSAGGWAAGAVPQRDATGAECKGLHARAMFDEPRKGYVLMNVEPEHDAWDGAAARRALDGADLVVALTTYATDTMCAYADVILPIGAFSETAGTFVNADGRWQTFAGVGRPVGDARPAWRVLRVLGNLLSLDGFDYNAPDEIHNEIRSRCGGEAPMARYDWTSRAAARAVGGSLLRVGSAAIYGVDPLVRRGIALQKTPQAAPACVSLSPETAERHGLSEGDWAEVKQTGEAVRLPVAVDEAVPPETAWIPAGMPSTAALGPLVGEVSLERA
ncbi:MAG TPA: NADH-quinone oxidoreductase subunit NuoG [Gammaproteobacteria bacterium]|nr:NADH-quinone oxidoreductase subunit NuoG [Gammaproteobacteria bacterium]